MTETKNTVLAVSYLLAMSCGGTRDSPPQSGLQTQHPAALSSTPNEVVVSPFHPNAVVAFSDAAVPIVNTITMSDVDEFQPIVGATVGTVEPGTHVVVIGVMLGGFHNDPVAYRVTTSNDLNGFVTPELVGLPLEGSSANDIRYVQAQDLIRMQHQGCPNEGPFATVTIWSDGHAQETPCVEVSEPLPPIHQGAVF